MTCARGDRFVGVFIPLSIKRKGKCSDKQRTRDSKHSQVATNPSLIDVCAKMVWQAVSIVLQNVDEGQQTNGL